MLSRTMLPRDEEMGKKDDDHKPGAAARIPFWTFWRTPLRWRRRRILMAVVGLYLVYLFVHNIPDLGELNGRRIGQRFTDTDAPITNEDSGADFEEEPTGPPKGLPKLKPGQTAEPVYEGQIRFFRLAASLQSATSTQGYRPTNRNVLFAISNLKSATTMLPMICEMSRWKRNWVHIAFLGKVDMPIDAILEVNGIDKENCPAFWHDARPDYMEWSSDIRAEKSVQSAIIHMQTYLHPQVAIMDDSLSEDPFFVRGMRAKCRALEIPIIEVPQGRWENFMWITRLDSGSLRNWHRPTVDILIQAPSDASGGVTRLLKSIMEADYAGLKLPRLTVELPADVDPGVKQYIENFAWPPDINNHPLAMSQLTIRRRIASHRANQEDTAIRFLELFFPTNTAHSHVLMLAPNAELSPLYFHYLKYVILEFKYSAYSEENAEKLMGVSLELPSVLLDGKTQLRPPRTSDMNTERYKQLFPEASSAPFLWQAPNSHAALFFGDKWVELHSFLSSRVQKQHQSPTATARPKLVSERLPSWTEYMLEFMRARGYSLYYPSTASSNAFVTVHNELYHPPEEYASKSMVDSDTKQPSPSQAPSETFLTGDKPPGPPKDPEPTIIPRSRPLHLAMPFEGDLPEIPHLPYLLYSGKMVSHANATLTANSFADRFRETVGGCSIPKEKRRKVVPGVARDLFCFGDEDGEDWEEVSGPGEEVDQHFAVNAGKLDPELSSVIAAATKLSSTSSTMRSANTLARSAAATPGP